MGSQVPFSYLRTDPFQMDQPTDFGTLFHRLNNQLGIILANAELLETRAQADDVRARAGQIVAGAVEAIATAKENAPDLSHLVVAGGVAANQAIGTALRALCDETELTLIQPTPALCTDNGAMIAWAGLEHFRLGHAEPLDFKARPRWPLDPDAPPAAFAGAKA